MGQPMGIGAIGGSGVTFKRKFRWNFTLSFSCGGQDFNFTAPNVYTGGRPKVSTETVEVHYLGSKLKVPGQEVEYEPLTFSFYDVNGLDLTSFYTWVSSYMRLSNPRSGLTPNDQLFGTVANLSRTLL